MRQILNGFCRASLLLAFFWSVNASAGLTIPLGPGGLSYSVSNFTTPPLNNGTIFYKIKYNNPNGTVYYASANAPTNCSTDFYPNITYTIPSGGANNTFITNYPAYQASANLKCAAITSVATVNSNEYSGSSGTGVFTSTDPTYFSGLGASGASYVFSNQALDETFSVGTLAGQTFNLPSSTSNGACQFGTKATFDSSGNYTATCNCGASCAGVNTGIVSRGTYTPVPGVPGLLSNGSGAGQDFLALLKAATLSNGKPVASGSMAHITTGSGAGNTASAGYGEVQQFINLSFGFTLAVAKAGTGSGTVSSNSGGINCGASCSASIAGGASVTLTATAAAGSYFSGWSGDCTGSASCVVTMTAARNVTATFKPIPFAVATTSTIAATATVNTRITFNSTDVGKQGAVFVTGWVPSTALTTLGITSADLSQSVTLTQDDPHRVDAADLHLTQGSLAQADANSFVLVQLTASGWQLVVNGQLIPYASGVLGDQLAAQAILNNTSTGNLTGAQFCLGYGTSSAEMIASGRMLPVAAISDPSNTGSCNVAASVPASPYTGLYWNASESGWGMSITQHNSINFVAWYTYDAAGKPLWYAMSSCPLVGASCTGDIYSVTGGTPLGVTWNGAGKQVVKVGSGTLAFADNNTVSFNYSLNGVAGLKNLTRQVFAAGIAAPVVDYSDLWWNANESGWGISLTQQYDLIFAVIYTYDAAGNPLWYFASSCPVLSNGCSGTLYQVAGGKAPTVPWSGANLAVTAVGNVSFTFTDSGIGTMNYTINGVSASKAIVRQAY